MAQTNLLLATTDATGLEDRIDNALVGLLAADGPNLVAAGRRNADASLVQTMWIDDVNDANHVSLMVDSDMPANWLAVQTRDDRLLNDIVQALRDEGLPILDYHDLLDEARRTPRTRGVLSRLALTHDRLLEKDLPGLVEQALHSADASVREDAVMAAHLGNIKSMSPTLRHALANETDGGVKAMLEHTISQLES